MDPSVACKRCSEDSQAAIVPQQYAEGSAMLDKMAGIILKEVYVVMKH